MTPRGRSAGKKKMCRTCLAVKPKHHFYRNSSSSDGYRGSCKSCESLRAAMRRELKASGLGLYDTPYGERVCGKCNKLVPVGKDGNLAAHFFVNVQVGYWSTWMNNQRCLGT